MDRCLNCNGAILEPNVTYGYAGKVCYCPKPAHLQWQRPASKEPTQSLPLSGGVLLNGVPAWAEEIRNRIDEVLAELRALKEKP